MRLTPSPGYTRAAACFCLPSCQKAMTAQKVSPELRLLPMCVSNFLSYMHISEKGLAGWFSFRRVCVCDLGV